MTKVMHSNCVSQSPVSSPDKSVESFSMMVYDSFDALVPLKDQWNRCVLECNADVYMTFEWCSTWWKHYGRNRKLQIVVAHSRKEIVGILPVFIDSVWLGPVRLRIAKFLGSDFTIQLCNPPVKTGWMHKVVLEALKYLITGANVDTVLFDHLPGTSKLPEAIVDCTKELDSCLLLENEDESQCHTVFSLPASFDQYIKNLGRRQRGNYKRDINFISRSYEITSDVVSSADAMLPEFEQFRIMHDSQWNAQGKLGHFRDWPSGYEYNRDLVIANAPLNQVRFYRIFLGGELAASQYCFAYNNCNYWRLPARIHGPDWDRFGLGRVAMIKMFEESIKEGIHTVEAGIGHYGYKVQSGGVEYPMRGFRIIRRNSLSIARAKAFASIAFVLDVFYYKILFARVAPRVPFLQRPIWQMWIRSRI